MSNYLVRYDIDSSFYDLPKAKQLKLEVAEVEYAGKAWKEGNWLLFFAGADKTVNWGVYKGDSVEDIETLLQGFPMYPWYSTTINEGKVVNPLALGIDNLLIDVLQAITDR